MSPRIRIFLLTLLTALVIAPAQASAASSACGVDLGPYAPASQDQTVVSNTNWQVGIPAGSVDIPLVGTNVDAFEYKVNCGTPVVVNAAVRHGDGHRRGHQPLHAPRRATSVTGTWTDWVDEFVRIDSGIPVQHDARLISSNWRKGPADVPGHRDRRDLAVAPRVARRRRHLEPDRRPPPSTAPARTRSTPRPSTPPATAPRSRSPSTSTTTLPVDTTDTAPVGWQPQAVDLKVDGTDADSGVDHVEWQIDAQPPGSGPDGTIVQIGTQGKHIFRTRVVDEVGNVSAWRSQDVWVNILGPIDTTNVPTTWYTTPTVDVDITGTDNLNRDLARIQWRSTASPAATSPTRSTPPSR